MRQKIKLRDQTALKNWSINEAKELYNIPNWSKGFFDINTKGNMVVLPYKNKDKSLDIKEFVDELEMREISPPLLIRFTDILRKRIEEIQLAFNNAIGEYNFKGRYYGVYPIKVNQSKQVVEDIIEFGKPYKYGLEVGSKAELLIALATLDTRDAPLICNGYKDREYIEMAMWGQKIGRKVIIVIEKLSEVNTIINISRELKVKPVIGIRAKLSTRGRGKWEASGGDRSKFGLFPSEIIESVNMFKEADLLDSLQLTHFHLGSQITSIQSIKEALRESARIYVELIRLGVKIKYFDVGGGLAVDYDGSQSNFSSSANYTLQEYASDVVSAVAETCNDAGITHPDIISESGRALVAYHSVLIFNVLGESRLLSSKELKKISGDAPDQVMAINDVLQSITVKNFQEAYHDALQIREETLTLFNVGMLSLEHRAFVEQTFWEICHRISKIIGNLDYVPDELENLSRFISDTYYANLSVFQSLPDHWAVKQLFPIVPIHRLKEKPSRTVTFADITCDSDGKIDQFIDLRDVKDVLEVHELKSEEPYYIGAFLVGAYQEILGDLHNLFGDTNTVHVTVTGKNTYKIDRILEGDSVKDVLSYMQYNKRDVMSMIRRAVENGIQDKRITIKESARIQKILEEGIEGYTYLE